MVRIFGIGGKRGKKKRLSPTARTPEAIREKHPMYQYALNEYAQTVAPGSSNDDGKNRNMGATGNAELSSGSLSSSAYEDLSAPAPPAPSGVSSSRLDATPSNEVPSNDSDIQSAIATKFSSNLSSNPSSGETMGKIATRSPFEHEMPFASYEERYGEAYTGGNIKYIYPTGYTSMRPRSCPWKLSIVVCLLFTWLSVFIVGHCADEADIDPYETDDGNIDDTLVIEIRWCGSRLLYLIWALSMLITGLSAAYCGVIGYIKCRDFSVANSRSQPPGVVEGKSDYYVHIEHGLPPSPSDGSMSYRPSIYQADGTPQFWGAHIYRPTQAAVAITSR